MTPGYFLGILLYTYLISCHGVAEIVSPLTCKAPCNYNVFKIPTTKGWPTTVRHSTPPKVSTIGPRWMTNRKPAPIKPRQQNVKIVHTAPKNIIVLPKSPDHQLIQKTPNLQLNLTQQKDSLVTPIPILLNSSKAIVENNLTPKIEVATSFSTNVIPNVAITQPLQPIPILLTAPKNTEVTNDGDFVTSKTCYTSVPNLEVTEKESSKVLSTTNSKDSKVEDVFALKSKTDTPKIFYEGNILNLPVEVTDTTRAIPTVDVKGSSGDLKTSVVTPKDIFTLKICNGYKLTSNVEETKEIEVKNEPTSAPTVLLNAPESQSSIAQSTFDEALTKTSLNNLQNLKGLDIPQSSKPLEPIKACLVGYDEQIFEIINEVQKVKGTEIEVHFYSFQKCKFNYISTHMINIKQLLDILTKYNNYVCLNKDYVESYDGNKDCWYIQNLITAPSLQNNVNLHNHNIDIEDFKRIKTQHTPLTLNSNGKFNNNNFNTKLTICEQDKEYLGHVKKEIVQPPLENIISKSIEKECTGTIESTNNIGLASNILPNTELISEKIQTAELSHQTLISDKTMKSDIRDDQNIDIVLLESNDRNENTNIIQEAPIIDCKEYKNRLFYDNKLDKVIKPISSSNLVCTSQMISVPIETAEVSKNSKQDSRHQPNESENDTLVADTKQRDQTNSELKDSVVINGNNNFIDNKDKRIKASESLPEDNPMGTYIFFNSEPHKNLNLLNKKYIQEAGCVESKDSNTVVFQGNVNIPKIYPNSAILSPQKNIKSAQNKPAHPTLKNFPISVLNAFKTITADLPETDRKNIKLKNNEFIFQPPESKQEPIIDAFLDNPLMAKGVFLDVPTIDVDNTDIFESMKCSSQSIDQYEEIKQDFVKSISVSPETTDTSELSDYDYFKPTYDALTQSNQKSIVSYEIIPENQHFMESNMILQNNKDFNTNNYEKTLFSSSLQTNIEKEYYEFSSLTTPQTNAELNYEDYQPYKPPGDLILDKNNSPMQASSPYALPPNLEAFGDGKIAYFDPSSSQLNTLNFDKEDQIHLAMNFNNAHIKPKKNNILLDDKQNVLNLFKGSAHQYVFNGNVYTQYNILVNPQQFQPYNKLSTYGMFIQPTQDLKFVYERMPQMTDYYDVLNDNLETNDDIPLFLSMNLPMNTQADFEMSLLNSQANTKLNFNSNEIRTENLVLDTNHLANQCPALHELSTNSKEFEYSENTYFYPSAPHSNSYELTSQRHNEETLPDTDISVSNTINANVALPNYCNILSYNQEHIMPNLFKEFISEHIPEKDTSIIYNSQKPQPYNEAICLPRDYEDNTINFNKKSTDKYFENPCNDQNPTITAANFIFPNTYQNIFIPVENKNVLPVFQYSSNSEPPEALFYDAPDNVIKNNVDELYLKPEKALEYEIATPSNSPEYTDNNEYSYAASTVKVSPSYDNNKYYEFVNLKNPYTQYEREHTVPNLENFIAYKGPWLTLEQKNTLGDKITKPYFIENENSSKTYDGSTSIETTALLCLNFSKPENEENYKFVPHHVQFDSPANNENEQNEYHLKIRQNKFTNDIFEQPYEKSFNKVIPTNTPVIKKLEIQYNPVLTDCQKGLKPENGEFLPYTSLANNVFPPNLQETFPKQQIDLHRTPIPVNIKSLMNTYTPLEASLPLSSYKPKVAASSIEPYDIQSKDLTSQMATVSTDSFPSHQVIDWKVTFPWTMKNSYDTSTILGPTYMLSESKTPDHSPYPIFNLDLNKNIVSDEKYSTKDYVSSKGFDEINMPLLNYILSPYKTQGINNNIKEINYKTETPLYAVETESRVIVSPFSKKNHEEGAFEVFPNNKVSVSKEINPYCVVQETKSVSNPTNFAPPLVNRDTLHAEHNYYDQKPFEESQRNELFSTKLSDNWIEYNNINRYTQSNQPSNKQIIQQVLPILTDTKPEPNVLNSMSSIKYTDGQWHQLYPGFSKNADEIKPVEKIQNLWSWPCIENKFEENSYDISSTNEFKGKYDSFIYPDKEYPTTIDNMINNYEENNNNYVLSNECDDSYVKALIETILRKNSNLGHSILTNSINNNLPVSKSFLPYVLIRNDVNDKVNIIKTDDPRIKLKCVTVNIKRIKPKLSFVVEDAGSNLLHIIPLVEDKTIDRDVIHNIAKDVAIRLNKDPIEMKIPFSNNVILSHEYMKCFDKDRALIWPAEYLKR